MAINSIQTIGDRIKQLRTEKGWTQKELGKRLYVEHVTISAWEKGNNQIKTEALKDLAKIFDVSISYIINGEEERKEIIKMRTLKYIFGAFDKLNPKEILGIDSIESESIELTPRQIHAIMKETGVSMDYILDETCINDADRKAEKYKLKCQEAEKEAERKRLCAARDKKIKSMFLECGVNLDGSKEHLRISYVVSKIFNETGDAIEKPWKLFIYNNFKLFQYMRTHFCNEKNSDLWQKAIDEIFGYMMHSNDYSVPIQSEFLSLIDEASDKAFGIPDEDDYEYADYYIPPTQTEIKKRIQSCYFSIFEQINKGNIEFDPKEVLKLLKKSPLQEGVFTTLLLKDYCEKALKS